VRQPSRFSCRAIASSFQRPVALGLPGGTLIYAADEGVSAAEHVAVRSGKRLRVVTLDLAAPSAAILKRIADVAGQIKRSAVDVALAHAV
jgi:hypothetical protein